MDKPRHHIGLRTVKTALAVTISLAICALYGAYSPIFAGIGAISAMTRTMRDAMREALTQFAGVLIGGVIGLFLVLLWPQTPPWAIGLGIVAAIMLCNLLKITYVSAMACIIVLSACTGTQGSIPYAMLYRLMDTSVGLLVGVVINITVKPYNNRPAVLRLLRETADSIPATVDECVLRNRYPDLEPYEQRLHRLRKELFTYEHSHLLRNADRTRDAAFLGGCVQLATRMYQELGSLSCMDTFGIPSAQNLERLRSLGLEIPKDVTRKCTRHDSIVTNYHLEKLLDAREYLLILLQEAR